MSYKTDKANKFLADQKKNTESYPRTSFANSTVYDINSDRRRGSHIPKGGDKESFYKTANNILSDVTTSFNSDGETFKIPIIDEKILDGISGNFGGGSHFEKIEKHLGKFRRFKNTTSMDLGGMKTARLFFTRPELFLFDETKTKGDSLSVNKGIMDGDLSGAVKMDMRVAKYLDCVAYRPDLKFIPFLSTLFKECTIPDAELGKDESAANIRGVKIKMANYSSESTADETISVTFRPDKYNSIYKMVDVINKYLKAVTTDGSASPRWDTIVKGRLDYTMSIIGFILGPDGETVEHWFEAVGVYIGGNLNSIFPYNSEGATIDDFTVPFVMNVPIDSRKIRTIAHFNELMGLGEANIKSRWQQYLSYHNIEIAEGRDILSEGYWWSDKFIVYYDRDIESFKLISMSDDRNEKFESGGE